MPEDNVDIASLVTGGIWPERNTKPNRVNNPRETESPTKGDPLAIYKSNEAVARYLEWAGENNMIATAKWIQDPSALAAAPEIASTVKDVDVTGMLMEQLYGPNYDDPRFLYEDKNITEQEGFYYRYFNNNASEPVNIALLEAMSHLNQDRQMNTLQLSYQYFEERDMTEPNAELEFIVWLSNKTNQQWQDMMSDTGLFGKVAHAIEKPQDFVAGTVRDIWNSSSTPDEAWHRTNLTWGQIIGVQQGYEVDSQTFHMLSGGIDGAADIFLDPVGMSANFASGAALARKVPLASKFATKGAAFRQAMVPIKGGKALNLPLFSRGPMAKAGYLFGAKHIDKLLLTPNGRRVVAAATKAKDIPSLQTIFPEWKRATGVLDALAKSDNEDETRKIIAWAFEGGFDESSSVYRNKQQAVTDARKVVDEVWDASDGVVDDLGDYTAEELAKIRSIADAEAPRDVQTAGKIGDFDVDGVLEDFKVQSKIIDGDLEDPIFEGWNLERKVVGDVEVNGKKYRVEKITSTPDIPEGARIEVPDGELGFVSITGQPNVTYGIFDGDELIGGITGAAGRRLDNEYGVMHGVTDPEKYRGVMGRVWEMARKEGDDFILQSGQSNSLSQSGFEFARSQAQRILETKPRHTLYDSFASGAAGSVLIDNGNGTFRVVNNLKEVAEGTTVVHLVKDNLLDLSSQKQINKFQKWAVKQKLDDPDLSIRELAERYARAMGKDGLHMEGEVILLDTAKSRTVRASSETAMGEDLIGAVADWVSKDHDFRSFKNGRNTTAWVVKDMPTGKFPLNADGVAKPRWNSGTSNAGGWWKRTIKNRFFGQIPEAKISLGNASDGASQLKKVLSYIGVPHDDIMRMTARFYEAEYVDRFQIVLDIFEEAGEIIEHPLLRHQILDFFRREGVTGFGIVDGEEVLTTASKSTPGTSSPRPFLPSMMKSEIPIPDPHEMVTQLRRYKWAKSSGPSWNAGLKASTQENRAAIVTKLKARLGDAAIGVDDDELLAMAYSAVGDTGMGNEALGAVAKFRNTTTKGWRKMVQYFSIAQLAGRFLPWFGRVNLDEQARGAFADLPSVMRNPVRYLSSQMEVYRLSKANEYKAANLAWATERINAFKAIEKPEDKLKAAREMFTNWSDILKQYSNEEITEIALKPKKLDRIVARALNDAALKNDFAGVVGGVSARRQRAYQKAIDLAAEFNIDITREAVGFSWQDDFPEILNNGWGTLVGLQHRVEPVEFFSGRMTDSAAEAYAHVWLNQLQFAANDPLARYAMRNIAAKLDGEVGAPADAAAYVFGSSGWGKVEAWAADWARENGYDVQGRQLFDLFVEEKIEPYVRTLFGDFLDADSVDDDIRFLEEVALNGAIDIGDVTYNFRNGSQGLAALQARALDANKQGRELPTLLSFMNPHNLMDEPETNYWHAAAEIPGKIIHYFGDELSQKTQRRGAFLQDFRRQKRMLMNMGTPERRAVELAKIGAAERINDVYYNMEAVTPFLKNMNQIIPFFTAAWEITSTWAWKIPMMQGPFGLGHAAMIRRIDRVMSAMTNLGLIQYDETGQPMLSLDAEASSGIAVNDALSKAGANTIRLPLMFAEHMMNLGHALTDNQPDILREDGIVPDRFTFSVSNPVDIEHYGIGSALDISLSMQPLLAWGASELRQKIPAIASHQTLKAEGDLAAFSEKNHVDPHRVIAYNVDVIREELGSENLNLLLTGALRPQDIDMSGIDLRIPNTSIWSSMTDELFFPFGELTRPADVITSFSPTWVKYAFRALGLWQGGEAEDGFLGIDLNPVNKAATTGQVISSLRHLDATEGVFGKIDELREEFYALAQPYLDTGQATLENGELRMKGEQSEEVNAAWLALKTYSENVMVRAIENGASVTMMRAILAAILPGNPRLFYEEEKVVDAYYAALARNRGNADKPSDIASTVEYLQAWIDDPTGKTSAGLFAENHPELKLYLQGKSYWGPGGQPPLERSLELYFQDVEEGLRIPYDYDVYSHKAALANVQTEREQAFIEKYGDDPYRAAAASLADPLGYRELMEEFNTKRAMLDYEDELNGHPYENWRNRNRSDNFDIIAESQGRYEEFERTVSDIIAYAEADPNMSIDEIKDVVGELKGLKAGIRDIREELENADSNTEFMSQAQQYRLKYFDEVYGPYLDLLSSHFEALELADTSEQQDVIWNKIARLQDNVGSTPVYLGGQHPFPAPTVYQWENKDPAIKDMELLRRTTYKPEWLSARDIDRLVARTPELERWLPTTPMQRKMLDDYNEWIERIELRYNNGTGDISSRDMERAKENMEEQLRETLIQSGNGQIVEWMDFWPIQKLYAAGQLPPTVERSGFVQQAASIQQRRAADGYKSVGDDDEGRRALTRKIWAKVESDRLFAEELRDLGERLYGESLLDTIIPKLFFNDRF